MMKNVLLVDDDFVFTFLNKKIISSLKFVNDIGTAQNGLQALEYLSALVAKGKPLPDIILLDLNMPIMDGFAFLEAFANMRLPHKERIKIIIVTSSMHPQDLLRARSYGVTSYLSKPLREEGLLAEISNA